jgi:hypothetical protein
VYANDWSYRTRRLWHLPRLDTKDHQIAFPNFADIIRCPRRIDHKIPIRTIDPQPLRPDRAQVFPTRNEDDILSRTCQPPAEVPTHATCSKYSYSHVRKSF